MRLKRVRVDLNPLMLERSVNLDLAATDSSAFAR